MDLEKGIHDNVVRSLATYISSASFQRQFEQFFLDNALTFTDEQEHQLDYMAIYIRFQEMFNKHMEDFLASENITEEEFGLRCQKVIKDDPKAEQYLEIVIASMDYDAFYNLMKAMRSRASLDRSQADAKASDDDGIDRDLDEDSKATADTEVKRMSSDKRDRDNEEPMGDTTSNSESKDPSIGADTGGVRDAKADEEREDEKRGEEEQEDEKASEKESK